MTQVRCKWIVQNPRWLFGGDGEVLFTLCVCVRACRHAIGRRDQSRRAWCKIVKSWEVRVRKKKKKTPKARQRGIHRYKEKYIKQVQEG